jgi:hypothetical protein
MRAKATRASPLPPPANEAIYWLAFAQKIRTRRACEQHSRARNRSSEKNADKSQHVGKLISRNGVMQQNPAAMQREIRFCASHYSASLHASTTLMEVRRVDLGLKLNVLAVCAAFVFVGAILLGAF